MTVDPLTAVPSLPPRRHRGVRTAAVILSLGLLAGCAGSAVDDATTTDPGTPSALPTPTTPPPPTPSENAESAAPAPFAFGRDPARVAIPAIDLDEPLIPLGLDEAGAMEVPVDYDDVGWFTGAGRPGGPGPTIIAAHVDSGWGPAVFARLTELVPGDTVELVDVDDALARYEVVEVDDHPRDRFPTARVFAPTSTDELRVITCNDFDADAGEYLQNRVVYATRVQQ